MERVGRERGVDGWCWWNKLIRKGVGGCVLVVERVDREEGGWMDGSGKG